MPVKAFAQAKARLAPHLGVAARADLARRMGAQVLAAAAPLPTWVVCDDEEVAAWALSHGASVSWQAGVGLDDAVRAAVADRAAAGIRRVVVAHADLPLAEDLARLAIAPGEVIFVPDRREDGTNVAVVPAHLDFPFAYGPGSFTRHCAIATRMGLDLRVIRDDSLAWDVDVPDDLAVLADRPPR